MMQEIREWIDFACEQNGVGAYLPTLIEVKWNRRFTKRIGDAGYSDHPLRAIIRLSPWIWERASNTQRRETIIHETCHIVAWHSYGRAIQPHGPQWKLAMRKCGVAPAVYHTIDLVGINKFPVQNCPKPTESRCFVNRRALGSLRRGKSLFCTKCGLRVDLEAVEGEGVNQRTIESIIESNGTCHFLL